MGTAHKLMILTLFFVVTNNVFSQSIRRPLCPGGGRWWTCHPHASSNMDSDRDGIADLYDRCSETPKGEEIWTRRPWIGCAQGQYRDGTSKDVLAPSPEGDEDDDGIINNEDLCSNTTAESKVWTYGEWKGCAGGQMRDQVT